MHIISVPLTAWRCSPSPPGSLQAEVQTQNISRAYFVQFPWDRILAWLHIRSIVLWGSAKECTVPPLLGKTTLSTHYSIYTTWRVRDINDFRQDADDTAKRCPSLFHACFSCCIFCLHGPHCSLAPVICRNATAKQTTALHFLSQRGGSKESHRHVLVTEPLGSFREDVKEKFLLPIPADQPPSSWWIHAFFWKRSAVAPWYTFEGVWELSQLLFTYTSAIQSTSKSLLWSMLGYLRYEKRSMKPISIPIQM